MITFEVETAIAEIINYINGAPERVRLATKEVASLMRRLVRGRTPYDTGHAKTSWGQIEEHRWGYSFENPVPYITVLEEGLYPRPGPRTYSHEGRVYSRQTDDPPGGIIAPLIEDEQALNRIMDMVVARLTRREQRV